ncbi:F-box protein, partial [Streptococcus suis]
MLNTIDDTEVYSLGIPTVIWCNILSFLDTEDQHSCRSVNICTL